MFGVTGAGLTAVKYLSNDGKKARWNRDLWDRVSLDLFFFASSCDRTYGLANMVNYSKVCDDSNLYISLLPYRFYPFLRGIDRRR